ncbi:MAG: glycine--tRNA ligase [DPANN group archaeon]|nr:glycine--tRNA ligase [DPANN group archaeon]
MSVKKKDNKFQEQFISFLQQKGFIWGPEPELYGGLAGFYTYAPLGKRLKNNVENRIRSVFQKNDMWEVECPTIMQKEVWQASGHLDNFTDPLVACSKCNASFRADKLIEEKYDDVVADAFSEKELLDFINDKKIKCPVCGSQFIQEIKQHNLMMKTTIGTKIEAYNRPETATTTYLPFIRYVDYFRKKIPFGVFQIGKAYRNEISPRQHVLRMREFTQAEGQMFIFKEQKNNFERYDLIKESKLPLWSHQLQDTSKEPKMISVSDAMKKGYLKNQAYAWSVNLAYTLFREIGIPEEYIRLRQHTPGELAFYADDAWDLEIKTNSFGWVECCGIHDRTDYDLTQHAKASGKKLEALDENNEKTVPNILEIAFGTDRPVFALLDITYNQAEDRTVLFVPYNLAPIQVAVLPLVKRDGLDTIAKELFNKLNGKFIAYYDEGGSVGRRYARMDEKGTPYIITTDTDTLTDNSVTIRDRNSTKQIRIQLEDVPDVLDNLFSSKKQFEDLGKIIE